jgi:hypothetical protein
MDKAIKIFTAVFLAGAWVALFLQASKLDEIEKKHADLAKRHQWLYQEYMSTMGSVE